MSCQPPGKDGRAEAVVIHELLDVDPSELRDQKLGSA